VHGFAAQTPWLVQWKFAVQSASPWHADNSHRWLELQTMLGPQSAAVLHPFVQWFSGCAPPRGHSQGRPQMSPVPASWQSASLWQPPVKLSSHFPSQKGGRRVTPQNSPVMQSLAERHCPDASPPAPLVLEPLDPPWPPEEPALPEFTDILPDPHAAAATNAENIRSFVEERCMPLS
jgi:hypothetical protein